LIYYRAQLDNQIIFTTTLKVEELGKYQDNTFINNIDYSRNAPNKILNRESVELLEIY